MPPDGGSSNTPVCGDGTCAGSEVGVCPQDCGGNMAAQCGNLTCEAGETVANCPNDCQTGPVCGDGQCDMTGGENSTNCPGDCGGGGGTLNCQDQAVLLGCVTCLLDETACTPPLTLDACTACLGGGI